MAEKRGNATRMRVLPPSDTELRRRATDPRLNVWVAANAGSGKTTILRDRVLRLLVEGVAPDHILCITFTKAAAAEMQDRVFKALAAWVEADDAALRKSLAEITAQKADDILPSKIDDARSLFARAVETPGGLKIQTIHAFAERLLHLFPLEAGVPVDFMVLDEGDATTLKDQARRDVLDAASSGADEGLARAFDAIVTATGLSGFAKATGQAVDALTLFANREGAEPSAAMTLESHAALFGVDAEETEAGLARALLAAGPMDAARLGMAAEIRSIAKSQAAREIADTFEKFTRITDDLARVAILKGLYLTGTLEPRSESRFPTKDIRENLPPIATTLLAEMARVAAYVEAERAFKAFQRSRAMLHFAGAVLAHYTRAKAARNALDYDDLIAKLRLMLLKGSAAWVMMKLDAAIEHILIDEAQDTTPDMWDIAKALSDDFFSGQGQKNGSRSLFVVGDEKQSIFSFQGAAPDGFDEVRRDFAQRVSFVAEAADNLIASPVRLTYSFRSSPDILRAVDDVFADPARQEGVSALGGLLEHKAAHGRFPGLVELWPLEEKPTDQASDSPEARDAPVDAPAITSPALRLAERIANQIHNWLEAGARHMEDGTRIRPGDILILVRERNPFFRAMLRALKTRNIPVAGADRLKLDEEIVMDDVIAIAQASLLPQDDLILACALKSPLFGLDDAWLERIRRGTEGSDANTSLWEDIQANQAEAALVAHLRALQARARHASPYTFFSSLLVEPAFAMPGASGRKAFLTRLGMDVAEALDAFLAECYAWGQANPASLVAFLATKARTMGTIKRDMAGKADEVRVMTVHGAKGLEGRIVFLAETTTLPEKKKEPAAFLLGEGGEALLVWAGNKKEEPEVIQNARAVQRRALLAEYRRLLYVALTRAEDRLYIAGYETQEIKKALDPSKEVEPMERPWYALVRDGLTHAVPVPDPQEPGRILHRILSDSPAAPAFEEAALTQAAPFAPPAWYHKPAPFEGMPAPPLRPSRLNVLGNAEHLSLGEAGQQAISAQRRGILLHQLYERLPALPAPDRPLAGQRLLRLLAPEAAPDAVEALLVPVLAFLETKEGRVIFGAQSRAEIAITGEVELPNGMRRAVSARIDRLIVKDDRVEIIDIKTGFPRVITADDPIALQMALYVALIRLLFPSKSVDATIFWTERAMLTPLDPALLTDALLRITDG